LKGHPDFGKVLIEKIDDVLKKSGEEEIANIKLAGARGVIEVLLSYLDIFEVFPTIWHMHLVIRIVANARTLILLQEVKKVPVLNKKKSPSRGRLQIGNFDKVSLFDKAVPQGFGMLVRFGRQVFPGPQMHLHGQVFWELEICAFGQT